MSPNPSMIAVGAYADFITSGVSHHPISPIINTLIKESLDNAQCFQENNSCGN